MNILITGAKGFVGQVVSKKFKTSLEMYGAKFKMYLRQQPLNKNTVKGLHFLLSACTILDK